MSSPRLRPKVRVTACILAATTGSLLAAQQAASAPADVLLIQDVTLLSPERAGPLELADVLVRDGWIVAVDVELAAPEGARVEPGQGRFLVPGLIDSHVHVGHPILLDDEAIDRHPELYAAYREQVPRSFLHFGFTSVIDLDLRPEAGRGFLSAPHHPRLFHAGRGIRIAGGYGPALFPEVPVKQMFPSLVFEPEQAERWPEALDPLRYTPELAVRRVVEAAAVCVKTYVEPGFGGAFDWPVPSLATLRALKAAASASGLPFVVHATDTTGWRRALEAGADVLAHGLWHWPGDPRSSEPTAEVLALVAEAGRRGVAVQPTLRVIHGERETFTWERLEDPRLARALPPELLAWARTEPGRRSQRALQALGARLGPEVSVEERLAVMNQRVIRTLQALRSAGAPLLLGSDSPAGEGLGHPPGLNGLLELELWAAAGVPLDVLFRSATLANARAFGLEAELGSIEVGKRADLLLLSANPLEDVGAWDSIEVVIAAGEWLPRDSLSARR